MTEGYILFDLKHSGPKVGPKYKGCKNARAVIGTMHKSQTKEIRRFVTYSAAEMMTYDITNVDEVGCPAYITTKFENPIQCPSSRSQATIRCTYSP